MLFAEYDYETDIAVQREEAMQFGMQQGLQLGEKQGIEKGTKQGRAEKAIESARIMISDFGIPRDAVIEKLKLTPEQIAMID